MNIIQWKPFGEIDRTLEDSFLPVFPKLGSDLAIDLYEEKGTVVAKMNLPGIDPKELDILLEGDILTVTGSRREEHETETKDYYSKEIRRGSFSRSVRLPSSVNTAKTAASYKDGILSIEMPVISETKEKAVKIPVS